MEPIRDPEGIEIEYLQRTGAVDERHVLEIGCGNGRLTWRYAKFAASVVGVDPDWEKLSETATNQPAAIITSISFAQAAADTLPFADEAFDSAFLSWSL